MGLVVSGRGVARTFSHGATTGWWVRLDAPMRNLTRLRTTNTEDLSSGQVGTWCQADKARPISQKPVFVSLRMADSVRMADDSLRIFLLLTATPSFDLKRQFTGTTWRISARASCLA